MSRSVDDKNILDKFAEEFCIVVEKHCRYIIVSGFVAIAHGRSRGTEDIDMIIEKLPKEKFVLLHYDLEKAGFECMQSSFPEKIYDDYLKTGVSARYTRRGAFLPEMEVKFTKDSLDELQLTARKKLPFTGLNLWFSSIETNIAFKEEYLKSEKDLEDAKHLRIVYQDEINEKEIEDIKNKIKEFRMGD